MNDKELLDWLEGYFAVHEGGIMGCVEISWDEATRDFLISLRTYNRETKEYDRKTLGCSRGLRGALKNAATQQIYD